MKEYEIIAKLFNACGGIAHAQTFFEEAELETPDDFIRMKHRHDFEKFTKEIISDKQTTYKYDNGSIFYVYEFTEI